MHDDQIKATSRLALKRFTYADVDFIVSLVNSPGWLTYIGDRNIHSSADARKYLTEGPMASYAIHGFGLWKIELNENQRAVGMCGLLKRDHLDHPDIGFAMLPEEEGKGYATEAARATLEYAREHPEISEVLAITKPDNSASIALLARIGFKFREKLSPKEEVLNLYAHALQ